MNSIKEDTVYRTLNKAASSFSYFLLLVAACVFTLSLNMGEVLAHHVGGAGYNSKGHLTTDGNVNRCHAGDYGSEAQNSSATWSSVTTNKLNMYFNCTDVELRTKGVDLNVNTPLGYVVLCIPSACFDAKSGAGYSQTLVDSVWVYSEAILNSDTTALGGSGSTTNNRRHTFTHEMGHALTSLEHRGEAAAVMRQGKLENITPIQVEITLMEAKY
jgi:hypothetical protein